MTTPEIGPPPWDPGMQNERTRLAWQRTTLAGLTCTLLVARLVAEWSLALAIVLGLAALVSSAALGWFSSRRYLDNRAALYAAGRLAGARSHVVLALLVLVTALGAGLYVVAL